MSKPNDSFEAAIKQASKKKSILFDLKKTWTAYLVLIIMVVCSFILKDFTQKSVMSDMQAEFDKSCTSVITRVNNQYDRIKQVISSTQGLYYENVQVVRDYFELYGAVPVKTYPFIMSIAFAPKVLYADWSLFHYNALSEGYWTYDLSPPGVREFYYPIEHLVDFEKNKHRLAYDYATDPIIYQAINIAVSKNILTSTEFYDIRQDTLAFALIAPLYKKGTDYSNETNRNNSFFGSLVMEVNAKLFFTSAIFGKSDDVQSFPSDTSLVFSFIDIAKEKENVVFKSENYSLFDNNKYVPLLTAEIPIKIADRNIIAKFVTVPNFGGSIQANIPMLAFIAALLISIIAFLLIILLLTQKARAEEIAERMTASQRRILETSKDIIAVLSMVGEWLSMNPISLELLGIESAKAIGTKFNDYLFNKKDEELWNSIISHTHNRIDIQFKANNAEGYKWISWDFTTSKEDQMVYAIGRDVTLEKQVEKEARCRAKQIELAECYAKEASIAKNYLMIKLNHQLRNQLTSVMGYLQLISEKVYETEDELQSFVASAFESSENAFTFISDASEATIGKGDSMNKMTVHTLKDTLATASDQYFKETQNSVKINYKDGGKNSHVVADIEVLLQVWKYIFSILSKDGNANIEIELSARENNFEGVTEILIETNSYSDLTNLVEVYNSQRNNIIEMLKNDVNDILLNIAKIASFVSVMMGAFVVETIDNNRNYISITLPLVDKTKEE